MDKKAKLPDLYTACKEIGQCFDQNVPVDREKAVIDHFGVPLKPTTSAKDVYFSGGILKIMHPFNFEHCLFIFPHTNGLIAVNSWIGPNLFRVSEAEMELVITNESGPHYHFWWED